MIIFGIIATILLIAAFYLDYHSSVQGAEAGLVERNKKLRKEGSLSADPRKLLKSKLILLAAWAGGTWLIYILTNVSFVFGFFVAPIALYLFTVKKNFKLIEEQKRNNLQPDGV